jgi:hypothetical protein
MANWKDSGGAANAGRRDNSLHVTLNNICVAKVLIPKYKTKKSICESKRTAKKNIQQSGFANGHPLNYWHSGTLLK